MASREKTISGSDLSKLTNGITHRQLEIQKLLDNVTTAGLKELQKQNRFAIQNKSSLISQEISIFFQVCKNTYDNPDLLNSIVQYQRQLSFLSNELRRNESSSNEAIRWTCRNHKHRLSKQLEKISKLIKEET